MAKIQAVWALDIGQAALKALKLVPGDAPEEVRAEAFDFIEYPKILSQPDADAEELVREAMTTFLERNDLKGSRVAIAVPGQAGLVKFIKLPPVEKKRIPDIVKFEARQQIPFALEEVIWDYQQIGGDEDEGEDDGFTMAEVGLFAMKRDQIHRAIQPFKNAGIEVDIVQMGPIALFNFLAFDKLSGPKAEPAAEGEEADKAKPKAKSGEEKGSIVLIDIGADNTDLIISDGVRIWQRNVPIGGNHFTRALTKELKLTFAKAEHLKRNATKAPDPRSVFTAMRGVFNDFSSEINRSIGFYSSVNRKAKITKLIGMGNGFKLPGLQKFLQQNLSYEVEKLEAFDRLTGEEVLAAPQFVENLPSFAVAYGLGLQGLTRSKLRTNLLPPEIEQVRMIRRKKPWALAAAALLMLGFSTLFLQDWKAWAKVNHKDFTDAVSTAKTVADQGNKLKSEYGSAKSAWEGKLGEGKSLFAQVNDRGSWPALLREVNNALPNPATIRFDPNDRTRLVRMSEPGRPLDPFNRLDKAIEDQNRIHIDLIAPVWKEDLAAWFEGLPEYAKSLMLAYDRSTPPEGEGWVVQIVGHHYNSYPLKDTPKSLESLYLGPTRFLQERFLRTLAAARFRQFGISHPTVFWVSADDKWVSDKAARTNSLPSGVPLLARATGTPSGGGMGMGYGGMGGKGGMPGAPGGEVGGEMGMGMGYGAGGSGMGMGMGMAGEGMGGPRGMMGMGYGPGMGGPMNKKKDDQTTYLTRTDFLVQFAWKPIAPDAVAKTDEEIVQERKELEEKMEEAEKNKGAIKIARDDEILAAAERLRQSIEKAAMQKDPANGGPAAPGAPNGAPAAPEGAPAAPKAPTP